jgi:hypothetical protein
MRSASVEMPCRRRYWPRYHSAAALAVPYGESGAIAAVSGVGISRGSP